MKKKLGIFSISVIAFAMFFNINMTNKPVNSSNIDLGRLMLISSANAEQNETDCDKDINDTCWDPDTGTQYANCDSSWFWDTCGS